MKLVTIKTVKKILKKQPKQAWTEKYDAVLTRQLQRYVFRKKPSSTESELLIAQLENQLKFMFRIITGIIILFVFYILISSVLYVIL